MNVDQEHDALVFDVDGVRCAIAIHSVERVVRAVEVTPLPGAPEGTLGVVDVHGALVPVFDMRRRLGLGQREIHPDNQLVIARTASQTVALVVDAVADVRKLETGAVTPANEIAQGLEGIRGIGQALDGLILIQNLDTFLSPAAQDTLTQALQQM